MICKETESCLDGNPKRDNESVRRWKCLALPILLNISVEQIEQYEEGLSCSRIRKTGP